MRRRAGRLLVGAGALALTLVAVSALASGLAPEPSSGNDQPAPAQVPAAPLPPNPLWRVLSYQEAQRNLVPVLPGAELTATFRDDGAVTGTAGCNGYRGPYVMTGQQIKIGPLVSTRRACLEDALNRQEQAFLLALEAATGWSIAGERMTLLGANGTPVVVFIYAGPQPTPTP